MRIDVMIPSYGSPGLVQQAVRSVLDQTHQDLRLVVVDDADPDPTTAQWVAGLDDPRVTLLRNPWNLGVNANFARCVELVEATYFTVMGCDDLMLPDHVATIARLVGAHPGVDVVQPGVEVVGSTGLPVVPLADRVKGWLTPHEARVLAGEPLAASLLRGNWTYFPALAWRTETVRSIGFRPDLEVALDLALLLDVAAAGGRMAYEPAITFRYRRHAASVSSRLAVDGRRFAEERAFFRREGDVARRRGWDAAARAARLHLTSRLHAAALAPRAAHARDWRATRDLLGHALL